MIARIYLVVHSYDVAILVDQNADAARVTRLVVGTRAVSHSDAAIGVAKQWKRELVLIGELGIALHIVEADTQDLDVIFIVVGDLIAEPATFHSSAGRVGLRIEPQDNFAAA